MRPDTPVWNGNKTIADVQDISLGIITSIDDQGVVYTNTGTRFNIVVPNGNNYDIKGMESMSLINDDSSDLKALGLTEINSYLVPTKMFKDIISVSKDGGVILMGGMNFSYQVTDAASGSGLKSGGTREINHINGTARAYIRSSDIQNYNGHVRYTNGSLISTDISTIQQWHVPPTNARPVILESQPDLGSWDTINHINPVGVQVGGDTELGTGYSTGNPIWEVKTHPTENLIGYVQQVLLVYKHPVKFKDYIYTMLQLMC